MKKRQIIILASTLAILVVGYGGCRLLASQKKAPERKAAEKAIRLVKTATVVNDTLISRTPLNGKLVVSEKFEIYPEVTGKLVGGAHPFKVGQGFKKGEVLLAIDGRESYLNLQAQRSTFINAVAQVLPDIKIDYESSFDEWSAFLSALDAAKPLAEIPSESPDKLKRFLSGRNLYQQYYTIKSMEERQSKFTIVAPFNGVVSMGNVYQGTLLRAGQKLGEFIRNDVYELEAAIPTEDAVRVAVGDKVEMQLKNGGPVFDGEVIRIAGNVDPMSQRVSLYASIKGEGLKEGLYMEGNIAVEEVSDAVYINRNLVSPEQNVYVLQDGKLLKKRVEIVDTQGDQALVKGLENGDVLMDQFIEGAYEGMPVKSEKEADTI